MRVDIRKNGIRTDAQTEKIIERKAAKLKEFLKSYQPDLVFLRVNVEKLNRKEIYTVKLLLELPGKTLRVEKENKKLSAAVTEAFDNLLREVKKFKELLRHEGDYKRKVRPSYKELLVSKMTGTDVEELFLDFVEKHTGRFYNFALREIRNKIYQGFLKPGEVQVRDILDEAVLAVSSGITGKFDEWEVKKKIYAEIMKAINRRVKTRRIKTIPLERKIEVRDLDTELYEYYQPDDLLKIEDVIPDPDAEEPDEFYEEEQLEETVDHIFSLLPDAWRQALRLVEVEGFSPEEVAMIQGNSPEEVKQEIEKAKEFARAKLADYGLKWSG